MADPVKKSASTSKTKTTDKGSANKAVKAPEKIESSTAKKRATTSKVVKAPAEPAKAKTAPQAAPAKPPKVVTARATKAKEETSPLIHKPDASHTPADGPKAIPAHPVHHKPKATAQERYDLIAMTAYFLYTQRGGLHGRDLDDWVAAETLVAARLG